MASAKLCDLVAVEIEKASSDPACIKRARKLEKTTTDKPQKWVEDCIAHWSGRVFEQDIGVDWADAHDRCWRCGAARSLQKCHVVARQFGGSDDYSNIIPMCSECHDEAPDVTDAGEMWRWIKETRPMFYGTLKAERAIAICVGRNVDISRFDLEKFCFASVNVGVHLMQNGTGCRIKASSLAWAIEQACKTESANGI